MSGTTNEYAGLLKARDIADHWHQRFLTLRAERPEEHAANGSLREIWLRQSEGAKQVLDSIREELARVPAVEAKAEAPGEIVAYRVRQDGGVSWHYMRADSGDPIAQGWREVEPLVVAPRRSVADLRALLFPSPVEGMPSAIPARPDWYKRKMADVLADPAWPANLSDEARERIVMAQLDAEDAARRPNSPPPTTGSGAKPPPADREEEIRELTRNAVALMAGALAAGSFMVAEHAVADAARAMLAARNAVEEQG